MIYQHLEREHILTIDDCKASCTPPPSGYNCVNNSCDLSTSGKGTYLTIDDCKASCTPPPSGYNCVNNSCDLSTSGKGTYLTIDDCKASCNPPPSGYNCVNNSCDLSTSGKGTYLTIDDCKASCTPPPSGYNCVNNSCDLSTSGKGTYLTIDDCKASCNPPPSGYNCVNNSCDLSTSGLGKYATISSCESTCHPTPTGKTLQEIMEELSSAFNSNKDTLITTSYSAADTLYKGVRSTTPPHWNPSLGPDHPYLKGSETTQSVELAYKLDVKEQGIAYLDFLNRITIYPSGHVIHDLNISTAYGNLDYTFDYSTFKGSVSTTPFIIINYIGMKKKTDRTTIEITKDEYEIGGIIEGIITKFEYIIYATYDSRYLWGLELIGKNDKDEKLYNLYEIKDPTKQTNNNLILRQTVSSFEDVEDTLSDHANGSIINVCRHALEKDETVCLNIKLLLVCFVGSFISYKLYKFSSLSFLPINSNPHKYLLSYVA